MMIEVAAAVLLAAVAIWLVLGPLMWPDADRARAWEPPDPEETARGVALSALREIEFDRETGKLSDADYAELKSEYTVQAVAALREEAGTAVPAASASSNSTIPGDSDIEAMIAARARAITGGAAPTCRTCGPRPETDAVYCSTCGRRLDAAPHCAQCSAPLAPGSNFCEACGAKVAA